MDQLRARVYTALLLGRPVTAPPSPGLSSAALSSAAPTPGPARASDGTTGCPPGSVNLTMPLTTWLGAGDAPGDVGGFGPVPGDDARALAELLAAQPGSRWCLTLTSPGGRPVAHGCARPGTARAGRQPGADWELSVTLRPLTGADCAHERQSAGYQPSAALRHLVSVRNRRCAFPGCRWPAHRCDLDHTVPHHEGGATCECNLAPLCRRHHRAKQTAGWHLDQPEPGVLVWHLPHGRRYTVTAEPCPI
jgi:hypothetical protein